MILMGTSLKIIVTPNPPIKTNMFAFGCVSLVLSGQTKKLSINEVCLYVHRNILINGVFRSEDT